jgi:hypothetical protein
VSEPDSAPSPAAADSAAPVDGQTPEQAAKAQNAKKDKKKKEGFTFTDDGCRTELRIGALLLLAAVFLWLFLGPARSAMIFMLGVPLLAIGAPLQAWQGRTQGRPGYPWKLAIAFTVLGAFMWPDMLYRDVPGGPVGVQPMAPMMLGSGLWLLLWWPVSLGAKSTMGNPNVSQEPARVAD